MICLVLRQTHLMISHQGPALGKDGALPLNGRFVSRSKDIESLVAGEVSTPADSAASPSFPAETKDTDPVPGSATSNGQGIETVIANLRSVKVDYFSSVSFASRTHVWTQAEEGGVEPPYWPRFRQAVLAAKATVLSHDPRPTPPLPQRREGLVDDAAPSELSQYNRDEALSALNDASAQMDEADFDLESVVQVQEDGIRVCADCRRPLKLDPDIGEMCIYLHALRYHSPSMGTYETEEPEWAHESWRPRPRSEI
jgi:hypothetical protein